jgi:hypothetical protein
VFELEAAGGGSPATPAAAGPPSPEPVDGGGPSTEPTPEPLEGSDPPKDPGPFEEFDLTPYRAQLRAARRLSFRLYVVLGLAFTAAGVAAASLGTAEVRFSWTIVLGVLAIFAGGGFLPLLLAYVPSREWRYPRTLRVEEAGFRIIDSGGFETRFKWEQPGLVVSIRRTERRPGTSGSEPLGEILLTVPYACCAIPKEARQSLLIESEANGLTVADDRFDAAEDTPAGRPAASVTFTAMKLPTDAPALAAPPPPPGPPASVAPGAVFELPKEVLPAPERSWEDPKRNPLTSLTFSADGFTLSLRNGRNRQYSWSDPRWAAGMMRRLETPLEPIGTPSATWHLSLRSPPADGDLSGEAYAALVSEARRAGRDVVSSRTPTPVPPHQFWIAETTVRAPPAAASPVN